MTVPHDEGSSVILELEPDPCLPQLPASAVSIKKLLGRGGFAAVYTASLTHGSQALPCALKVLSVNQTVNGADRIQYAKMFLREATATKLHQHESIIGCYGVVRIPAGFPGLNDVVLPTWALCLDLCETYTTKSLITQGMAEARRMYTNLQALEWLLQIASALAHLHSARPTIIHRDIKQENLLLKREPQKGGKLVAKLSDLGLHVVLEADRSVMLRKKSHMGGGTNRSIHARSRRVSGSAHAGGPPSKCGSNGQHQAGDETPFLAVGSVASRAPSHSMRVSKLVEDPFDGGGFEVSIYNMLGEGGGGNGEAGGGLGSVVPPTVPGAGAGAGGGGGERGTGGGGGGAAVGAEQVELRAGADGAHGSGYSGALPGVHIGASGEEDGETLFARRFDASLVDGDSPSHAVRSNASHAMDPAATSTSPFAKASFGGFHVDSAGRQESGAVHSRASLAAAAAASAGEAGGSVHSTSQHHHGHHAYLGSSAVRAAPSPSASGQHALHVLLAEPVAGGTAPGEGPRPHTRKSLALSRPDSRAPSGLISPDVGGSNHGAHNGSSPVKPAGGSNHSALSTDAVGNLDGLSRADSPALLASSTAPMPAPVSAGAPRHLRPYSSTLDSMAAGRALAEQRPKSAADVAMRRVQTAMRGEGSGRAPIDSLGALMQMNPGLVQPVSMDRSFTSGLRRVRSVLQQLQQEDLRTLRQSSIEWVFGLTGQAGSCMAPEVYRKLPYNEKADVFSFGVVMYELLARELLIISYFNTQKGARLGMHQPEDYAEMVCDGYRPPRCDAISDAAWALIEECWGDDPVARPGMEAVVLRLRSLLHDEQTRPSDPKPGCGCVVS